MARLIPRKQIEEQQNITGSLTIGDNLFLGNDALISGSLFVSKSFFLGNDTGSKSEITGSVFVTGSFTIDGLFSLGAQTLFSGTASFASQSVDTQRYAGILAKDFGSNLPTLYVSSTDGDDTNDGRSIQYPLRTIKRAAALSTPGYDGRYGFDTGSVFNGYVIKVQAGTYLEDNPVILPKNTTIWGAGLRITKINAKTPTEDLFYVNSGCYIAEVTMGGLRLYPDQINPEKGFAVAFQPGAFITTSPYVQNCSQISNQENSFTELYEDIPPGGGGLYVNGDVIDPDSPLASMVLDAYTQISPNGVGCLVNGRGFIQLVSFFNNFSYYAIRVNNGGQATLNNSNISFGLYGMYASGSRFISGSGGNIAARDSVRGTWSCVVDVLNKGLENGLPTITKLNTAEGIRLTSPALYTQSRVSAGTTLSTTAADEIFSDYTLISEIVDKGVTNFPTLLAKSSNKGYGFDSPYNILGAEQITSSISATQHDLNTISSSYAALLSILANGTGSFNFKSNTSASRQIGTDVIEPITNVATNYTSSVSSSFGTIINILQGNKRIVTSGTSTQQITNYFGETSNLTIVNTISLSTIPTYIANTSASIKGGTTEQVMLGVTSSLATINSVSASFSIVYNILANGTGSNILPIPANHQREYRIINNNSSSYQWIGVTSTTNTQPPATPTVFNVTNNGSGNYVINGQSNPTLSLIEGQTYTFNINASGHPFWIKTNISLGTGNAYNTGVTNNGTDNGTITFVVPIGAPTLYYNCQFHSSMAGTINTLDSSTVTTTTTAAPNNNITTLTDNPTITLFRGETYKFNVNAIEAFGGIEYPFWIRTQQLEGITDTYDYNIGIVNNGDSRGTITFTVPYNAPNRLYYVSQNKSSMGGKIEIVNSSATPFDLIKNTLTYPATIQSGSIAKTNIDIVTAYEILVTNKEFIKDEVIQFVSSSWSGFSYPEETCKRDVGYIVDGVAKDLLFGGNEESIRNGLFYYQYPSEATTTQLGPTLTAMKHAAGVSLNLIRGKVYVEPTTEVDDVWNTIRDNKIFVQNEVITYLSSSWSNFYYNEAKCRRDTGYILDAVATDAKYGGNERSIIAGQYYYQYPSLAIVQGDGDGIGQLGQTSDGIRYASGLVNNLLKQKTFTAPAASTLSAYNNLINNKELIQNETIQFINVAFPNLKYIQATCKRDVGYIVDNVATDLLYGGIERGVTAGRYYYDYPSLATTTQRTSTIAGIRYAKIIGDTIVQNQILDTPRIVYNDEKNFRLSTLTNVTSSFSGSVTQQTSIGNTFSIIEGIVARGLSSIKSLLAQNTGLTWNKYNPISVSSGSQTTSSYTTPNEVITIGRNFDVVNTIIGGGIAAEPLFTSSHAGLTKVTTGTQTTASFAVSGSATASLSSSFALITGIITDGVKSFTPTTATYNPANGNFVMTIPSHTLKTSNGIYLRPESFVFTCDMDGNRTEHKLPSAGQPAYNNRLIVQSITSNTVTLNVGASGPDVYFNPTNATYNPATGDFVITVASHSLSIGEGIVLSTGSFAFTCDMDGNQFTKSYPRFGIDPYSVRSIPITAVTATTMTVNVGVSAANKYFTPTSASYNALTGDMSVTVGQHGLGVGRSVILLSSSIAFTCDQDNNATTHSYPRSGSDPYAGKSIEITSVGFTEHTVTNAPYNAETGDVTITIVSHSFSNGDYIKLSDNSLTYTCILDDYSVSKSYPRPGYDYPSGRWLSISGVTTSSFDINIGASSYTSAHTFVTASINGLQRQNGIFTINVGDAGSASGSIHTFVSASANAIQHLPQSVHTFVSASSGAVKHLPQAAHTFVRTNKNSVSTVPVLVQNTYGLIKVTNNVFTASSAATNAESASISSSFALVERVLKNGTSIIPALTSSLNGNIKVTSGTQIVSSSLYSGSLQNVAFISSSISIVTKIIEFGEGASPAITLYSAPVLSTSNIAAYNLLKLNIPFIVSESIAYLSSSWSSFEYDENKCKRDLTGILSGSAEDLIFNANSASVFNGNFYLEFPSKANDSQLVQTLDAINYASRLAQKVIQNIPFAAPSSNVTNAKVLLRNNTQFIKDETIAYLSSSWIAHDYNETTCKRDVGHILDAAITDMVYGGNERTRVAAYYYFTYPSAATGSQLMQTIDGINYANRLAQKTVLNSTFVQAESNKVNASNLIRLNRDLIANEVVEYVSSSWSDAPYDDIKCRRDIKYILDAVRTDLVYGGNERSKFAGEYYYEYPSKAIVAGVPSATAQLDSTITGIDYGSGLVQNIIKNNILSVPSSTITNAAALVRKNRAFLQQNTVDYANEIYPNLDYIQSKCYRDTGFIVDAVITDLVYGGNERSVIAGRFYYLYPSQATGVQSEETIDSLNFTKGLAKLVAIGGKSIEDGFDIVANVIESGSNSAPVVVLNTADGIKATTAQQITSSISVATNDKSIISSSFGNIINILSNGTGSIPTTIVKNTNKGVKVLDGTQITSSKTPSISEKVKVTTGFDTVIDIVANGTGSIPTIVTNVNSLIRRTATSRYITTASIASTYLTASNNSFDIVLDIVENGTDTLPTLIKNVDGLVKITNTNQYTSSVIISSSIAKHISGSFDTIINILQNGTGSKPTTATYNPANGNFVITIPNHSYKASDFIYLRPESFVFTCDMDGNRTEHKLPSVGQRAYNSRLSIISVTPNTITVNVGISGPNVEFTPTAVTYDPATGNFVLTVGPHTLSIGEGIVITTGSIAFTCDMDNNQSTKSYPRFGIDPYAGRSFKITNTTYTTLTVNAGISAANKYFTPSAVNYNALTGDMDVTVGQHGLGVGRSVILLSSSIAFTCDQDNNATTHSYPRSGSDPYAGKSIEITSVGFTQHTITNAPYNAETGDVTITIASHGFSNGDYIKISDNSLVYTCILDDNLVSKSYPRAGYDYPSGRWLSISGVTTNTFNINVGPSSYTSAHTFISATANGLQRQNGIFRINVGDAGSASGSIHTFVSASANAIQHLPQSVHTFVSASTGAVKHLPQAAHTFVRADRNAVTPIPIIITPNISANIKVTDATQYFGVSAATQTEANAISASISIVTNIIANGTGSLPIVTLYTSSISSSNVVAAYTILKSNLDFIVSESIAYLSSSWSTASYDESKCRRDLKGILSGSAEDLIFNANSASVFNGVFYYQFPSQAQGAQLNQTLDGIKYASRLAQKLVLNTLFVTQSAQVQTAYTLLVNNKELIKNEVIPYISSSWSTHQYIESTCKRDVGHIIDAVSTDLLYGGNERTVNAGIFYYQYPSDATGSQIQETVTGIEYARNLTFKIIRGNTFVKVSQNKLQAKELIYNNRAFIQNEVISYISASWSTASYNETTCKRDVGHILDAVTTDIVYGGNERSINAGKFYYEYPSQATTSQLGPTLSGIKYAKDLTDSVLKNSTFVSASNSNVTAYELIFNNKAFIQNETIAYLSSSWSAFSYNQTTCKRDIGYILDAVATDILYGGNERVAKAGEYYYLYPSLATVGNDGDTGGQLNQTLDGIKYAKGITEKIVANLLLQPPTTSELAGFNLLLNNKKFIQSESIAFLSSSWSGDDGFYYNETTCKRDIGHIIDAVRTDLVYGGNERSSKAGEYYYLYPSAAILTGSVSPTVATQKGPTLDGINYVAGTAKNIIENKVLIAPTGFVTSSVNLLRQNKRFIQNETVQYIDAFFPNLVYLRETCRRDVGYILDAVITDTFYGGNQRSVIAGQYYYLYPSLATKSTQVRETVAGVDYAKAVAKAIVQNIKLNSPTLTTNTDGNIKVTNTAQYTSSSISASIIEVNQISSSFGLVTGIINDGVKSFTPTTATYNPANGEFVITIPSHTLTKYNSIYIRPESFVFTCEMDGNRTEHKLPGVGQYPYSNKLQIQSVTTNTITVNVGASGPNVEFTPTSASYNPATGNFVVTVGTHSLSIGEGIVLSTGSFAFTCDMDNNQSTKSYPRFGIDPYSVRSIPLTAVTDTTLTFNVGVSAANKYFTPTSASYNALTGDMVVNVGQHGLGVGRSVTLASASIAFTCDQDNNATTHSYPRSGSDPYAGKSIVITSVGTSSHTITNAPYNSSTGVVTLTVAGHGFSNGDYIKISDNSLTYTCILDDYSVSKSYPRPGYDYPSGRWLEISNVTTNTFTINVGSSNYIGAHTFVSATANGLQRQTGTFTINVGNAGSASGSIHTFVSASANAVRHLPQSVHTFVSASAGAIKHLPQAAHTFVRTTKNSISTIPVLVQNGNGLIKVTNTTQYSSSISASGAELDIITSSFKHVADIIENGVAFVPDSLVRNYNYGFELSTPTLLHISSKEQTIGTGSYNLSTQITNVSSSYGTVVNVVKNGLSVLPTLVTNTSSSLKVTNANPIRQAISASSFDTNKIASGFDLILSVIENGTSLLPTIISNTSASIKVTNTPQLISGSASGRLQGKLISSSLSLVIDVLLSNGTSSIGFKPSSYPTANTNAKINSAYNLLVSNSKFIVDETIAYMSSSWSGFEYTQSKCERDLTGILSGSAFDLLYGGNSASLFNGKFYFDYPSNATGSQLDQTITAIKYASGLAEKVVLNNVFTHISASQLVSSSASYNSLRENKGFIQSESIAYLSASWAKHDYNETTCKRDIGYIIDAVATDLLYGGNERSVIAGRYYYDYPSQATNAQLEPTLTGVRYAKGTAMNVVVNKQIFTASLEVQYAYDLIKANKLFIQSESVAYVNVKYPNLDYSESKCYRDLGYIIDGVATDLLYGGNERSRDNADYYYQFPSQANGFGSQVVQTTDAIKYAARFTTASISSTLIAAPYVIPNTQANIKVTNATQLVTSSLFGTVAESTKVSASISIVTNIIANGTASLPTLIPYVTPSADTNVIYAYNLLKANIGFIVSESIAYLSSSWSTASYDESKCGRDLRGILSGSAEDLLYNANSASLFNGIFYYQFPSQAQGAQLNQTLDGINYASILAQNIVQNVTYVTASANVSASYALIRNNREFIQNETIAYLSSSWSTASYIETTCKRDVGHIIDAVSTDLLYGGNERSTYAGIFYYLYPSQANGTGSQVQPTLTGVNYAGQLSKNVAASLTFVTASQIVSASVNLLRKNREFIQDETLAYLTASWSTFEYDKVKCKRDTGFIIDGVITDLLYGGNERGSFNGEFYYKYPSKAIIEGDGDGVGQLGQTIDGINYASRISQKIAKNILFVTASVEASASFDLLRKNKAFVAAETIAYVSSSWSGVYYNETTCKRDVGYLIDAAATDVLYGGQERSVIAGQYYYLYPSNAINKGVPSTLNQLDPTLTGIRYAGKLSKKVVINPTYLEPSASLITTAKLLTDNKQLIQKETITFLSSSWSNLKYNEVSCSRDLGFIIDAIRTDLVYGGNERSIEAGSYYYKFPSVAILDSYGDNNGQKKQTIDGINFARGISEKIVANTLLTYLAPATKRRQAAERLKGGKEELKQKAIGYTNGAFPYLVYNEASCSRDTGFIVDAAVTDLLYGGNERGIRAASSYYDGQYGSAIAVTRDQLLETLETNRYLRTRAEFIAAGAPLEAFGSLIVATGIDYSYNGSGVTFKALPPNQGGSGVANPIFEITELGGGRIFFTSGNQDGDFRIGTGLSINQATGTLVGRTFSKSLFSLVTPFSLALQI